jgi:hypothetical protein
MLRSLESQSRTDIWGQPIGLNFKDQAMSYPEMSVRNYHSSLFKIPEERRWECIGLYYSSLYYSSLKLSGVCLNIPVLPYL